jgi:NADH-quinone oxidoreductase subunit L
MVVAGVFLVARLFPVFVISCPAALEVVGWTGAISSLFAAVIACTQTDIKRGLAYSTMSQIGYMLFSLGVSGYGDEAGAGFVASQFHLFTHALFKALLFLVAGVVIHAVHTNEMSGMGGLRKTLPLANVAFLIGCLSIAGIPPFAGFFSKEAILHAAHATHPAIYWMGLFTAGLTAFYMFRLYFMIFWNRPADPHLHGHGAGFTGNLSLLILAAGAVFAGLLPFGDYVSSDGRPFPLHTDWAFSVLPLALSVGGILLAMRFYLWQNDLPDRVAGFFGTLYRGALRKFYIDEIYGFITKKIIFRLIGAPAAWFDRSIVDGAVDTFGVAAETGSESVRELQNGRLQTYGAWMVAGVFVLLVLTFYYLK